MVGKTLGHYEILEPLGKGGMGEVYRARDTTLKREVAIKVLPEDLASDPDRLARLEREAHLLAALNHTNIATIHSLEQTGETRFLVLELVKGESLQQRLASRPLRPEVALDLCKQIAEALEAAHGEGIIHRDLKPANVLITPNDRAKVLDFGLAKVFEANDSDGDITMSPTLTVAGTQAGVILGTAPYMSPEQIRGLPLDKRVDIWAFGCVMYETLTASRAFARETVADTLAAILESEPNWEALPGATPPAVVGLVKRCLRKDPARRLHDIADARIEVEEALSGGMDAASTGVSAASTGETTRGIPWTLAVPLAVAIALAAALGVWVTMPAPELVPWQFDIDYPAGTRFESTSTRGLAFSPDGKWVVFNANGQLWRRASDETVPIVINGTEGARTPFFSPDSRKLGFWGPDGQMKSVPITGGAPDSLGEAPLKALGASWAEDEYIYFGQAGAIWRIPENGGQHEVIVVGREGEQAYGPQLLPGGEWLLFTLRRGGSWDDASIVAQRLSGGDREQLVDRGTDGRYVRQTGHLVYFVDGDLHAVAFDTDSMAPTGGAVSIIGGVRQSDVEGYFAGAGQTGAIQYAFSDLGGLVYMPVVGVPGMRQIIWAGRDGINEPLLFPPGRYFNLDLSPDNERLALQVVEEDGEQHIWIYDLERGSEDVLTTEGNNTFPRWSHDGEWVFFSSDRGDGAFDIYKKPATKLGDAVLVWDPGELGAVVYSVSADGEMLLVGRGGDIGILRLDSGQEPDWLVDTDAQEVRASFSPDGRFFAYVSNRTGSYEAYVMEVSSRKAELISTPDRGGGFPFWSRRGGEIFFRSPIGPGILGVEVETEPFSVTAPRELSSVTPILIFAASEDGQRFLAVVQAGSADAGLSTGADRINVDLGWSEKLKRRAPPGGR